MNVFLYMFLAGLAVSAMSLVGMITTIGFFRDFLKRHLPILISFSAGVFLLVAFGLLSEALQRAESSYTVLGLASVGFIGISLIFRIFF